MGLGEKERGRVEANARVALSAEFSDKLKKSKAAHIGCVAFFLVLSVRFGPEAWPPWPLRWLGLIGMFSIPAAFVVPGTMESIWGVHLPGGRVKRCQMGCVQGCKVCGKWVLGFVSMFILFFVALQGVRGGGERSK